MILLRVICTVCYKGDLVTEALMPDQVVPRHRELSLAAGLIEIPSISEPGTTVFVCSEEHKKIYETDVGPFRVRQKKLAESDMTDRPVPDPRDE